MKRWTGCTATLLIVLRNRGVCDEMLAPQLRHVSSPAAVSPAAADCNATEHAMQQSMRLLLVSLLQSMAGN